MTDVVKVLEDWEAEMATAGITYDIEPDRIGQGFHVRIHARYGASRDQFGFATVEAARPSLKRSGRSIDRAGNERLRPRWR
jgi:hypothetical protein